MTAAIDNTAIVGAALVLLGAVLLVAVGLARRVAELERRLEREAKKPRWTRTRMMDESWN